MTVTSDIDGAPGTPPSVRVKRWITIKRTFKLLRPYKRLVVVSLLLLVVGSGLSLLAPWPLKFLIDNVLEGRELPPLMRAVLGDSADNRVFLLIAAVSSGLLLALLSNLLMVLDEYVNTTIHENVVLDFRSALFEHAQRLSLAFHDRRKTGQLIFTINNQGGSAAGLMMAVPPLVSGVLTLGGMLWITFTIDATLALLAVSVMPVLYYSVSYYMKNIESHLRLVLQMEGDSLSIVHEAMSMLKVIVAFGREAFEFGRFRTQGTAAVRQRVNVTVRQTVFSLVVNTTTAAGTSLVLGFGAYAALQGRLTVGELMVVMSYIAMIYKPLEQISTTVGSLQDKFISLELAYQLLDEEPEIRDRPDAVRIDRAAGHLTLDRVSFTYAGRNETLKDLSFDVPAGKAVAIVGPTGAGKTTLISLIPRLYDPSDGRILIDGRDVRECTLHSLRSQVSLVLQEPLLFAGTIADNIRYGRLDATDAEIEQAARDAGAHEFVLALPDQYMTIIGERGAQLSGGERQRISVARAFLKDAPILILDEPTSSIDSRTESVILDAIDRLMVGRTTLMVAHRLSTIRRADLILVLNQGELVDQGTHEVLMSRDGLYRQLYQMQTNRDAQAEDAQA